MERRFSVIVPVYEQWHLIPALLACLERQRLPMERFEIILVDNGSPHFSPPPTTAANVQIIRCEQPGSYAARNAAAAVASGDWFAFTDADCLPEPDWLEQLAAAADASSDRTILVGAVDMRAAGNRPNAYETYDMVRGIPQQRYARRGYGATANLSMSATLFHDAGGFDGTRLSGGDAEFCRRAGAKGAATLFVGGARIVHPARATWDELATKARRIKGGQLAHGSGARRVMWVVRGSLPPMLELYRLARSRNHSASNRLTAAGVQLRLWLVELLEVLRLLTGAAQERR